MQRITLCKANGPSYTPGAARAEPGPFLRGGGVKNLPAANHVRAVDQGLKLRGLHDQSNRWNHSSLRSAWRNAARIGPAHDGENE
jgi:hypothetical protein